MIRLILSIVVSKGRHLRQIDVSHVFLHGILNKDVYMRQPPGFKTPMGLTTCENFKSQFIVLNSRHILGSLV